MADEKPDGWNLPGWVGNVAKAGIAGFVCWMLFQVYDRQGEWIDRMIESHRAAADQLRHEYREDVDKLRARDVERYLKIKATLERIEAKLSK